MRATIFLATFNGAKHLESLLSSLQDQSFKEFEVLISDDGSTDTTVQLIRRFEQADSRFKLLPCCSPAARPRRPCHNFGRLMEKGLSSSSSIYFFCDQDDVWRPNKISSCIDAMASADQNIPSMVATSFSLLKEKRRYSNVVTDHAVGRSRADLSSLADVCSRNVYPGCTLAFNRAALELATPVPDAAIMHDWWLTLLVSASGTVIELDDPLISYRLHGANAIGVVPFPKKVVNALSPKRFLQELECTFAQAAVARHRLVQRVSDSKLEPRVDQLSGYLSLLECSVFLILSRINSLRIRSRSPLLKIGFLIHLLALRLVNVSMKAKR